MRISYLNADGLLRARRELWAKLCSLRVTAMQFEFELAISVVKSNLKIQDPQESQYSENKRVTLLSNDWMLDVGNVCVNDTPNEHKLTLILYVAIFQPCDQGIGFKPRSIWYRFFLEDLIIFCTCKIFQRKNELNPANSKSQSHSFIYFFKKTTSFFSTKTVKRRHYVAGIKPTPSGFFRLEPTFG